MSALPSGGVPEQNNEDDHHHVDQQQFVDLLPYVGLPALPTHRKAIQLTEWHNISYNTQKSHPINRVAQHFIQNVNRYYYYSDMSLPVLAHNYIQT